MTQRPKNIPLDFFIASIKLIQQLLDLQAFGSFCRWTWIDKIRKCTFIGKTPDTILVGVSQRPDDFELTPKKGLLGNHGTDFSGVTHINEHGFDDIILIMTQRDFITTGFSRDFKQALTPQSRT